MKRKLSFILALFLLAGGSFIPNSGKTDMQADFQVASRLKSLLTDGSPLTVDDPNFASILQAVDQGDYQTAANLITNPTKGAPEVYNVLVPNLTQTFNRDETNDTSVRDDIAALITGIARDDRKFSDFVTADLIYYDPNPLSGVPSYQTNAEANVSASFANGTARDNLVAANGTGYTRIGVLNSQSWGNSYLNAGTNRRPVYGILHHLFCTPISTIQTIQAPDDHVRRDVPRAPGGSVSDYKNNCASCHASWLDGGIATAYSRYDFNTKTGMVTVGLPTDKLNVTNAYPLYPITGTSWILYLSPTAQQVLGLHGGLQNFGNTELQYVTGNDLPDLASLIANSDGFYNCMVRRVVAELYMHKNFSINGYTAEDTALLNDQNDFIASEAASFKSNQSLITMIKDVAIHYLFAGQ